MPRTIFEPSKYYPAGEERDVAESKHRDNQHLLFRYQWQIHPPAEASHDKASNNENERLMTFVPQPVRDLRRTTKPMKQLDPEDIRTFCFKDCALYALTNSGSHGFWINQLFEKVYRNWFPSRSDDTDISHRAFFCELIEFWGPWEQPPPPSLNEVLEFHKTLCSKLDRLVPELSEEIPRIPYASAEVQLQLPPAVYKLRKTFKDCFIAMYSDGGEHSVDGRLIKEHGVVVVFLYEQDAARHGCVTDEERGITAMEVDGLGEARAFRCSSLECAMSVVLATDAQRSMDKRERHGFYRNEVLDQNDRTPTELCRCSGCRPDLIPPHMRSSGPVREPGKFPQLEQEDV